MAKTNIKIYIDEAPDNDGKTVSKSLLPKTPLKLGSRIPLTPARRNNSTSKIVTPAKGSSKLLISSQPTKLKEDLSSLPEIETFSRLQPSISQEISEIQLDELETPKMEMFYNSDVGDDDELNLEMLCLNEIDTTTRLQKSLAQEIADISLDSIDRPSFFAFDDDVENEGEEFVIRL